MKRTFQEHLDPSNGPKNILALDGGGIRGALTIGYLQKVERILRDKHGDPSLVLSDYFDLIGGTSTGSIIAALLSVGKPVEEIKSLYMDLGGKIFGKKHSFWKPWETWKFLKAGYDYKTLEDSLRNCFGDITLESDQIKTGLCIVAKRGDTNSTWPIINHPNGTFYDSDLGRNKDIPLWQAVRASSAAPTYFAPQMINVGNDMTAAFIDGGVSMANNPALTLLLVATAGGFPFRWPMGEDKIRLVSVGTGYSEFNRMPDDIEEAWLANWAKDLPNMFMQDSNWQNQMVLQWLSNSPTAKEIDMEMGKLDGDYLADGPRIKYLRYNFPMTMKTLNALNIGETYNTEDELADIIEMSNAENRFTLYKIGEAAAAKEIQASHFD